ncbi:uncharacterized protein G2W53_017863 [Senna tora]|uniref:Uncharacterized protein n=1 Tax=Senna tora TaxID=362788 RepID=A0A834WR76_9FABA|nr:uncharacterized protein G2W53_017863 [Senna tora]
MEFKCNRIDLFVENINFGKNDGVTVEIIFNSSTSRMPAQEWSRFQRHNKNGSKSVLFGDSSLMPLQLDVDVRALLTLRGEIDELACIRASCGSLNDIIVNNRTAKLYLLTSRCQLSGKKLKMFLNLSKWSQRFIFRSRLILRSKLAGYSLMWILIECLIRG